MGRAGPRALDALIEHGYRPCESVAKWVESLVEETATRFPTELGSVGRLWDSHDATTTGDYAIAVRSSRVKDAYSTHRRRSAHRIDFLRARAERPPSSLRRVIEGDGVGDHYLERMQRTFEQVGVYDMRHLTFDDGAGLWLTLGVVQNEPRPLVGTATRWEQVRRHLKAALYAQHAFDALRARLDGTPCGPHEQLRRRLREIDARDGCLGTDGAAELWCGLARGAWSLLDQFDCAGRRCLVLAPRIDAGPDPRQLTPNDLELATLVVSGKSRKWIALTLGVARSTLNRRLETLVAKLGQRSRHDLLKTFRLWCGNAIPALALRAQALGSSRYLLSFRLDRPSAGDWTCPASLTPAQWRVIQLALEGLSDRAIAENLDISRYTVGHHLRNAYARLRVNSRAELFVDLGRRS